MIRSQKIGCLALALALPVAAVAAEVVIWQWSSVAGFLLPVALLALLSLGGRRG